MAVKVMALRRDDACAACAVPLPAGTRAQWDSVARNVRCLACLGTVLTAPTPVEPAAPVVAGRPPIDIGEAGRSARAEYERRRAKRDARIEERWGTGRMAKLVRFLSDDPQTTKAWAIGAAGEERIAEVLHERVGDTAVLLHDRRVPGTRGNIDHLAIAPSGVWVIDTKKSEGDIVVRDVGGWRRIDERLYVGRRDRTKAVDGMAWQVDAVRRVLAGEDVPVLPVLAFVGASWPLFRPKPLHLNSVTIASPNMLAELIAAEGPLSVEAIDHIARRLATRLPSNGLSR